MYQYQDPLSPPLSRGSRGGLFPQVNLWGKSPKALNRPEPDPDPFSSPALLRWWSPGGGTDRDQDPLSPLPVVAPPDDGTRSGSDPG